MTRNFTESGENEYDEYVWVHDWYEPEDHELTSLIKSNKKLKGWHKIPGTKNHSTSFGIDTKCVLDLNSMKYYEHVPIVDHSKEKQIENEAKAIIEEMETVDGIEPDSISQTPVSII